MDHLKLTIDKLSVEAISDLVVDDSCGAVSIFVGTTRDNFEGKKVVRLEYEAYESMALKALKSICEEVREKWPAVHSIAIYHRLGNVPCREASVVIAVSSPHRRESLDAVSHCIEKLKASVPIWKREVYEDRPPAWKENVECASNESPNSPTTPRLSPEPAVDKHLIQINVSTEELKKRIENFIERKREQVNLNNIHDFIPLSKPEDAEDSETCARVRTQFVRRSDSKGHLKIRKVYNEWGPQTVQREAARAEREAGAGAEREGGARAERLPAALAERVRAVEAFLHAGPVPPDIYRRLKLLEDKMAHLESISPEYAQFWQRDKDPNEGKQETMDYIYSAEDIERKIEILEKQCSSN